MGALATVYNEGPDALQVRIGGRWVKLDAGQSTRFNATVPVEFEPLPKVDPAELALHLGNLPHKPAEPPCRLANDD